MKKTRAAARAASIAAYGAMAAARDVGEITAVTKVNVVWSAAVAAWDVAVAKKGKKDETITARR
jgi:hypothetical protein